MLSILHAAKRGAFYKHGYDKLISVCFIAVCGDMFVLVIQLAH